MIKGVDSSFFKPGPNNIQQAVAAGVTNWSGYLVTKPNVGIAAPWSKAEFDVARTAGTAPIAYCSGWDDPVPCKQLAAEWDVRLCLDVESGIRGDGPWVQSWLDQSGAGLYGNAPVFSGRHAGFYILAGYPGSDPGKTWPSNLAHPDGPTGWQWQGTHDAFGGGVDSSNLDDWFGQGGDELTPDDRGMIGRMSVRLWYAVILPGHPFGQDEQNYWANQFVTRDFDAVFIDFLNAAVKDPYFSLTALQELVAGGGAPVDMAAITKHVENDIASKIQS